MRIYDRIDMTGRRYGLWTVVAEVLGPHSDIHLRWLCECDCGEERLVAGARLRAGTSKSCGCRSRCDPICVYCGADTSAQNSRKVSACYACDRRLWRNGLCTSCADYPAYLDRPCPNCGESP